MESTRSEAGQLIARYLAGQLPPDESDAFEQRLGEHAELREQTEEMLKLKEGLARLEERGELAALLGPSPLRRWLPYAAAAAVAVVAVGISLLFQRPAVAPLLALSPQVFAGQHQPTPPLLASVVLARTRGADSVTDLSVPKGLGAIELRLLPTTLSPQSRYDAQIVQRSGSETTVLGRLSAGTPSAEGYVTIYVDSARLTAGNYEILLVPTSGTGQSDRFLIRTH